MKISPVHKDVPKYRLGNRMKSYLRDLVDDIRQDVQDRDPWVQKHIGYDARRYCRWFRNPTFPWKGSSNIVMPTIDKTIDRLKPEVVGLVTGARPPVTVLSTTSEGMNQATNVEWWFDWLIRIGSPYFRREVVYGADDFLSMGRAVMKTFWGYETRPTHETLVPFRLPERFARLRVVKTKDEVQKEIDRANGQTHVLTRKEFNDNLEDPAPGVPGIKTAIAVEYDLDPEEPSDKEAMNQIIDWFRQGMPEPLTIKKRDTAVDAPRAIEVHPFDLVIPTSTTDLEDAARIPYRLYLSERQMRQKVLDSGWNRGAVDYIIEEHGRQQKRGSHRWSDTYQMELARRENITYRPYGEYEILEVCCWYSFTEHGREEKAIALVDIDYPEVPLKVYPYQRPSGKWPYHTAVFEQNKRRYYSPRGVTEKLLDIDEEITFQHRAKLNRMTIANAPTFLYRTNRGFYPQTIKWIPGQFVGCIDTSDVAPLPVPNLDMSFDREEAILRTWGEEYIGGTDYGLANPLSNLNEPRTATEIRGIQGSAQRALSLRGGSWQDMMGEIYQEFFDLWHQWGPEEVWVRVTGQPPMKFTKEELQGDFLFIPTGVIGEVDKELDAAKKLARIQVLMQVAETNALGDRYELNIAEAVKDWLESDDLRVAKRVLRERSPEEIQEIVQERQRQEQLKQAALNNIPQSIPELREAMDLLKKGAPHGKAQKVNLG